MGPHTLSTPCKHPLLTACLSYAAVSVLAPAGTTPDRLWGVAYPFAGLELAPVALLGGQAGLLEVRDFLKFLLLPRTAGPHP